MTNLIKSEWIKVTTTKMWWILFIVGIGLTVLSSLPLILLSGLVDEASGTEYGPTLLDQEAMQQLWSTMGSAAIVALILGILSFTEQYRHETITDTFLTAPRRSRVILAKSAVYAILGAILAVLTCVTAGVLIMITLAGRAHAPYDTGMILQMAVGVILCYMLYAILGVAIGALIINQIAAIVIALLWVMLIESLIVALKPEVGKWMPGGAASGILNSVSPTGAALLPAWLATIVLIGYAVVFAGAAAFTTLRRDIT